LSKKKKPKAVVPSPIPPKNPTKSYTLPIKHLIALSLIAVVALGAYANTFHVPFTFDDRPNISENPNIQIKTFTFDQFEQLARNTYKETIRIFAHFTFALNYYFGGFDVFGYHLVNLLIHIASGILLYWLLLLTLNLPSLKEDYNSIALPIALFSSLLFISHPVQTQSVTYIVQRMASMATMFYLLAMLLYVKARLSQGRKRLLYFIGTTLSFLFGLFTKENTAILPTFIALYEFYFFQNLDLNFKRKKILTYVAGAVFLIGILMLLVWGKRYYDLIIEGYKIRDFTLTERVLTQFRIILYYVTLLLYPHPSRLNLDYDFPISKGILDPPTTLLSILIIAGLIGYSIWTAKKMPLLSFFILWYFGNLMIESSIFPLELVFEHRLYLPAIGPFVLFAILVVRGGEKIKGIEHSRQEAESSLRRDLPLWIFILLISFLLCVGSYQRNTLWKNEITLWEDCIKKSPKKERALYNLGRAYYDFVRYKEALEAYQRIILLKPNYQLAYNGLGLTYKALGFYKEAIEAFQGALLIQPNFTPALNNLGATYTEMGRQVEAIEILKKAIQLKPDGAEIHNNLGVAYRKAGQYQEAIEVYKEAIRIKPDYSDAYNNLGLTYYNLAHYREAIEFLKKAIQLKPDGAEIHNNLGVAYRKAGQYQEAIEVYKEAIRIKPDYSDAYNNLGLTYYSLGHFRDAIEAFKKAIRLKSGDEEFHYNLGVTYTALGNHLAAIESYKETIRINQSHVKARFNLGLSYLVLKSADLAFEQYKILKDLDKDRAQKLFALINQYKIPIP
jgi:tetratricopeptide (TPR) repeat protein